MRAPGPYRSVRLGPADVAIEWRPDGTILARSPHPLGLYPETMIDVLDHWAHHASYRTFLAERDPNRRWRNLTYAETQFFSRRIGQALLNRGLSVERPVVVLSANSIERALLDLGAATAGVPYAPIPVSWTQSAQGLESLRRVFEVFTPGLVFIDDGARYEQALRAVMPAAAEVAEVVVLRHPVPGTTQFDDLVNTNPEASIDAARGSLHGGTVFRILYTAGAGLPKGVIHMHRNWTSSQEMTRSCLAFLADEAPIVVGGIPWSHAFGGHMDIGLALYNGGTLYLDDGEPVPGRFEETVHNLRMIAPTLYANAPVAFEALVPYLQRDPVLRQRFFSRLRLLYDLDAGVSDEVRNGLSAVSAEACGECVPLLAGLGSTETVSAVLFGLLPNDRSGFVGVPAPGVEIKLVPEGEGRFEARVRGPNVTVGYWRSLESTRAAFDEEGFFRMEVHLRFADDRDPLKGFALDRV